MNWAGYISTGGTYTTVSGTWKVPSVAAGDDPVAADATWIGIGGDTSDDLIQTGTENIVEDGQVAGSTFYEELPNTAETIPTVTVNPGDTVTASIKEVSSGEWTINIEDVTDGESYSNTVSYDSSESSAEWIEEAPSDGSTIVPLDQFGPVTFTGGSTTENGQAVSIAGSDAQVATMDNDSGQALATVSALSATGDGFTVTRTAASNDDSSEGSGQYGNVPGTGWTGNEPGMGGYYPGGGRIYRVQSESGNEDSPSSVYMSW
jgi:hypothetical protein